MGDMGENKRRVRLSDIGEVFWVFLKLGLSSFGGPVAHIGFFRRAIVERARWLPESQFAQLLALSQLLPGPASSQLGFSLGLVKGGVWGGLAAWAAFTLPSALLMFGAALAMPHLGGPEGSAALHGLKLAALVVVAQGVLGMLASLSPDAPRRIFTGATAAIVLVAGFPGIQLALVALGALAGSYFCPGVPSRVDGGPEIRYGARMGWMLLAVFLALLIGLPIAASIFGGRLGVAAAFYRAGALVFGGGHVVLPLLKETVVAPGWVPVSDFMAGYGLAQAVPGPMFSLASYLGALLPGGNGGLPGAAIALGCIFLPGLLLIGGILPFWKRLTAHPRATAAVAGVNAVVVGLLLAALYDPVWLSAVKAPTDLAIAMVGFVGLNVIRLPVLALLGWCTLASVARALFVP